MMFKSVSLERAPLLLRFWSFFRQFMLILPVIILVYKSKGLTTGDFFLLQGLFAYVVFFLEIPTGYIGDLFSRKKVIILSSFVYCLGYLFLNFAHGFWEIFLVEAIWGLSLSLSSGTRQAYLYDVLKKQKKESSIIKEEGRVISSGTLGTIIATLLGGLIFDAHGPETLIAFATAIVSVSFILSLFLPDLPEVRRVVENGKSKWKDILDISKYAVQHSEIKWMIIFPAAFGAGTLVMMWSMQPLMELNLIPAALFGFFVGSNMLFRGFFSYFSDNLFRFFKTRRFSIFLFIFLSLGFVASILGTFTENIYVAGALIIVIGMFAGSQAGLGVVMKSMINHRIKSDERATVLSVDSMLKRVFCGSSMMLSKYLIDGIGLREMYIIIGLITLPLTFWSMKKLLKLKI